MVSRLVLGCGSVGHAIVETLVERPGRLVVVDDNDSRVETLRAENVSARKGDPTDTDLLENLSPDVAFVGGDDPDDNLAAARALRLVHPDSYLVTYVGEHASSAHRTSFADVADDVVAPGEAVADQLVETTDSESALRTRQLQRVLRRIDGKLGIFTHDNPDPDAIASGIALQRIADAVGTEAEVCYYGDISHQENRAFVNLLDLELRNLEPDADLSEFDGLALVDHSVPGVNDQLPEDTPVDIVVDHHPPKLPVEAEFIDLRSAVGATSTLMADHFEHLGIEPSESVATGLLYGIRVDTKDFSREVSVSDFEAAAFILPHADTEVLDRVEDPSISPDTLETIARAIRNRRLDRTVLASCVGALSDRDALAQAADRLLDMEDVTTTLVFGFIDSTVYVSARARGTDVDLGETVRAAFGRIGSAGGHADMAGAQIPLGLLGEVEEEAEESLSDIVGDLVTERFFETMRSRPEGDEYAPDSDSIASFDIELAGNDGDSQ
ncbi:DHH family phosphoesterase [Halomicrococcus gelatinilyticus]|uniref:DHH family phosphoesterase n=1 Tax=Halomicrococcus gelatinilyticus TaxID=1702103 RepID=UPI002E150796